MFRPATLACLAALASACVAADAGDAPTVTRIRAEPAGAHCLAGGRAVLGGPDVDGDGVLADTEVTRTDYLCAAPPSSPLFRSVDAPVDGCALGGLTLLAGVDDDRDGALADAEIDQREVICHSSTARALAQPGDEPAGVTCHLGGTVVSAGLDRDADRALADDEVERRLPLCALASANVLSRRDYEPPGRHCADGGSAVRSGLDDDLDGTLADVEVDTTVHVCDLSDVETGDVVIDWTTPYQELERIAGLKVILGALTIRIGFAENHVTIPELEMVGGGLVIATGAHRLSLPRLHTVHGDLRISGELQELDVPVLTTVDGEISTEAHALSLVLPRTTTIGGLTVTEASRVEAPMLDEIRGDLVLGGSLSNVAAPRLRRVASLSLPDYADGELRLPALTHASSLSISSPLVAAVSLPRVNALRTIEIDARGQSFALARLDLPSVVDAGELTLAGLGSLTTIDLRGARTIGRLTIKGTALTTLDLPAIDRISDVEIDANPALTMLSLDHATQLSRVRITANPRLASIVARAVSADVEELQLVDNGELTSVITSARKIENLVVTHTSLTDLQGLRSVETLGTVTIRDNWRLATTAGLTALTVAGDIVIEANPLLTAIGDLPRLTGIEGSLTVRGNRGLSSLAGLRRVARIQGSLVLDGHPLLPNTSGLDAAIVVGKDLRIVNNAWLNSLAGIRVLRAVGGAVEIASNPRLPAAERTRFLTQIGR